MSFDLEAARKAGYNDDEIADFLASESKFDSAAARQAGYSAAEIIDHLSAKAPAPAPKPSGDRLASGRRADDPRRLDRPATGALAAAAELGDPMRVGEPDVVEDPRQPPAITKDPLSKPYKGDTNWREQDLVEMSKSPDTQLNQAKVRGVESARARAPELKAAPERGGAQRVLDSTIRKPLDDSLGGLLLESGGDAARGAMRATQTLGGSALSAGEGALAAVGAGDTDVAKIFGLGGKAAREARTQWGNAADPNSLTQQVFESTFVSVPMALAFGGANAPLIAMGAQSAANEFGESRDRGLSAAEATERGVYMGLAEMIGEKVSLPAFQRLFAQAAAKVSTKEMGRTLAEMLVKEQVGEQATQLLQSGYEKVGRLGTRPDMTLEEYLDDAVQTAKVTLGQTLLTGGAAAGVKRLGRQPEAPVPGGSDYADMARSKGFLTPEAQRAADIVPPTVATAPGQPPQATPPVAPVRVEDMPDEIIDPGTAAVLGDLARGRKVAAAQSEESAKPSPELPGVGSDAAAFNANDPKLGIAGVRQGALADQSQKLMQDAALKAMFRDNLGIKREDMPVIPQGEVKDKFIAEMSVKGVGITEETVDPKSLKPSQSDFNQDNVDFMRQQADEGTSTVDENRIIISSDNRVIDGHHRWIVKAERGEPINALRVDMPAAQLLPVAKEFSDRNGMQARSADDADALRFKQPAAAKPTQPTQPRLDGETDKQFAKRVVDQRPTPSAVPESPSDYFDAQEGETASIDELVSTKGQQQANENAGKRFLAAKAGELSKRGPVIIAPSESQPGKFDVIDGNGTVGAARHFGWKSIPAIRFASRKVALDAMAASGVVSPKTFTDVARELVKHDPPKPVITEEQRAAAAIALAPLKRTAAAEKPDFDEAVSKAASGVGGKALLPPVKGDARAIEKAVVDYKGNVAELKDMLRATVVVSRAADIIPAVAKLASQFDVVRAKDQTDEDSGYSGVLMNVRLPSGLVAEIQVNTEPMLAAKEAGHYLYEITRSEVGTARAARLLELQRRLYGEAQSFGRKEAKKPSTENRGTGLPASSKSTSSGEIATASPGPSREPTYGEPSLAKTAEPSGRSTIGTSSRSSSLEPAGATERQSNVVPESSKTTSSSGGQSTAKPIISPNGVQRTRIEGVVQRVTKSWKNAPKVVVVDSISDPAVPAEIRDEINRQDSQGASGEVRGTFYKGAVYLYADAKGLGTDRGVLEVLLHESLGHYGLAGVFGSRIAEVLQSVALLYPQQVAAKAKQYGLDMSKPKDREHAAEEVLAELAQTRPELTIVERATAAIRSWLRTNMPGLRGIEYSEKELVRNFVLPARRFVEQGKGGPAERGPMLKRAKARDVGGYQVTENEDGSIVVNGDQAEIRSLVPDEIRGRLIEGGVSYTSTMAPRVLAALEGEQVTYGRGGKVDENPRYTTGDRKGQYIGAPSKYNTPAKIPHLRRLFKQLAIEGEPGKLWYERSGAEILAMVGGDREEARKFISLLAIYSPQAKVDANTTFALRAWAQYKAGEPISVKTGSQDRQATEVLYEGKQWGGEKTNNFFRNLMREVDADLGNKDKQGVTVDMWMMRAAGYDTDAPTQAAYRFVENETNRLAEELGWEPQQVQAAIWVAMKARTENSGVKKRTEEISTKKGYMRYVDQTKNGKTKQVREVIDEVKHREVWLDEAFKLQVQEQDTNGAKFDFSDGVRRHLGQISWEARPGRSTGVLPGVNDAPYPQQAEFQQAVAQALSGPKGEDLLAQRLGLLVDGKVLAPGVWQSEVAAGMQSFIGMAPSKGGEESVDPAQAKLLNVYSDVLGLLLRQEGVGWHKPFYAANKRDMNGLDLDIGRTLTPLEARSMWAAIDREMRAAGLPDWEGSAGMISTDRGLRVVSFGSPDNAAFRRTVEAAAQDALGELESLTIRGFKSDGDLRTNDWGVNPNGEDYRRRISAEGRPDVLEWAERVLAPQVQAVFDDFSERYGWGDPGRPGQATAPGSPRAAAEVADSATVGDPFADGYKRLEGRKVAIQVRVASTGDIATMTVDAAQELRELDERAETLQQIIRCMA